MINQHTSTPALTAQYEELGPSKTFEIPLASIPTDHSVEQKTIYLASLREAVNNLREQLNVFLTEKMAQETTNGASGVNDTIEEDNYGEDIVEET